MTSNANGKQQRVLIKFYHGLGDAVQFTVVLRHLRKYRPDWEITVHGLRGKTSAWQDLAHHILVREDVEQVPNESAYDQLFDLPWWENYNGYEDRPNTKITNCLAEIFQIEYDRTLESYQVPIGDNARLATAAYLESIGCRKGPDGRYNTVVFHYQGNTSCTKKNLNDNDLILTIDRLRTAGYVSVILDWDNRSRLIDQRTVFCPIPGRGDCWGETGTGDAERITALISQAALFIGIDSGPGKCAAASDTPAIIIWTGHHPIQFQDPSPNVINLVPPDHAEMGGMGAKPARQAYFSAHWRHEIYNPQFRAVEFLDAACRALGMTPEAHDEWVRAHDVWVRKNCLEQDLMIVRDIILEDSYNTRLYDMAQVNRVVDIGAHIGCFALLVKQRNPDAEIICVEANPANIPILRANVGHFAKVIYGACTYVPGEVRLANSIREGDRSINSGATTVASLAEIDEFINRHPDIFWKDDRNVPKVTLENLLAEANWDQFDMLKLDCEGSEYSILENADAIRQVRFIFGEWHLGHSKWPNWDEFRTRRYLWWNCGDMGRSPWGGLFHLINPVWPPIPEKEASRLILASLLPGDQGHMEPKLGFYEILGELVREFKPKTYAEFGVRAGYSARLVSEFAPECSVTGYDIWLDPDGRRHRDHALKLMSGRPFTLFDVNTRNVVEIGRMDMVLVDGDHETEGCLIDLNLASQATDVIIVDDYRPGNTVATAVDRFLRANKGWILDRARYYCDRLPGVAVLRAKSAGPLSVTTIDPNASQLNAQWPLTASTTLEGNGLTMLGLPETTVAHPQKGNHVVLDPTADNLADRRDFSEFHNSIAAVAAAEVEWERARHWEYQAKELKQTLKDFGLNSVVEVGCSTGWVPSQLPLDHNYTGFDGNPLYLDLARKKNPERSFHLADIRTLTRDKVGKPDLVCSWATMKHCTLSEWPAILHNLAGLGRFLLVEFEIGGFEEDNGRYFPHTLVTDASVRRVAAEAGLELVRTNCNTQGTWFNGAPIQSVSYLFRHRVQAIRIATTPGIGDAFWTMTKIQALLEREGADAVDVVVASGGEGAIQERALEFLKRLPFVRNATTCPYESVKGITPEGHWYYETNGRWWHGQYEWFLQANAHLEAGKRLEEWLPELRIDWDLAKKILFTPEEEQLAESFQLGLGCEYVVFYASSRNANTTAGHNRDGLWSPQDWKDLERLFQSQGLKTVLVGAAWDLDFLPALQEVGLEAVVAVGKWRIMQTLAVLKRAKGVIAYQSGLGIWSASYGIPTAMFWRPKGNSIMADRYVSFEEEMASAWCPPHYLADGTYLPCIYTKCSAASIFEHAQRHWLNRGSGVPVRS